MDNRDEQARDKPGDPGPSGSGIDTSKRTRIINNGSSSSHSTSSSDNDSRMSPPQRKRQKKSLRSPLQLPPDSQVAGTSSMADMMHFTIKTLDSRDHPMEVHKHSTVLELKQKIRELMGVEVDMQRLIFCGRVLQDEKRVADYKVAGKVVHMVERAPGCLHSSQRPNPPAGPNIDPSETTFSIQQQEYLFSPNHSPTMTRLLNFKTLLRTIRTSIKACKVPDPDTPDSESDSEESDEEEAYGPYLDRARNEAYSRPEDLADLSDQLRFLEEQFEPYRERYMMCLREANDPTITLSERTLQRRQRLADKVRAVFHNLSHAHHLLSDFNLLLSHNGSRLTSEMLVENRPLSPLHAHVNVVTTNRPGHRGGPGTHHHGHRTHNASANSSQASNNQGQSRSSHQNSNEYRFSNLTSTAASRAQMSQGANRADASGNTRPESDEQAMNLDEATGSGPAMSADHDIKVESEFDDDTSGDQATPGQASGPNPSTNTNSRDAKNQNQTTNSTANQQRGRNPNQPTVNIEVHDPITVQVQIETRVPIPFEAMLGNMEQRQNLAQNQNLDARTNQHGNQGNGGNDGNQQAPGNQDNQASGEGDDSERSRIGLMMVDHFRDVLNHVRQDFQFNGLGAGELGGFEVVVNMDDGSGGTTPGPNVTGGTEPQSNYTGNQQNVDDGNSIFVTHVNGAQSTADVIQHVMGSIIRQGLAGITPEAHVMHVYLPTMGQGSGSASANSANDQAEDQPNQNQNPTGNETQNQTENGNQSTTQSESQAQTPQAQGASDNVNQPDQAPPRSNRRVHRQRFASRANHNMFRRLHNSYARHYTVPMENVIYDRFLQCSSFMGREAARLSNHTRSHEPGLVYRPESTMGQIQNNVEMLYNYYSRNESPSTRLLIALTLLLRESSSFTTGRFLTPRDLVPLRLPLAAYARELLNHDFITGDGEVFVDAIFRRHERFLRRVPEMTSIRRNVDIVETMRVVLGRFMGQVMNCVKITNPEQFMDRFRLVFPRMFLEVCGYMAHCCTEGTEGVRVIYRSFIIDAVANVDETVRDLLMSVCMDNIFGFLNRVRNCAVRNLQFVRMLPDATTQSDESSDEAEMRGYARAEARALARARARAQASAQSSAQASAQTSAQTSAQDSAQARTVAQPKDKSSAQMRPKSSSQTTSQTCAQESAQTMPQMSALECAPSIMQVIEEASAQVCAAACAESDSESIAETVGETLAENEEQANAETSAQIDRRRIQQITNRGEFPCPAAGGTMIELAERVDFSDHPLVDRLFGQISDRLHSFVNGEVDLTLGDDDVPMEANGSDNEITVPRCTMGSFQHRHASSSANAAPTSNGDAHKERKGRFSAPCISTSSSSDEEGSSGSSRRMYLTPRLNHQPISEDSASSVDENFVPPDSIIEHWGQDWEATFRRDRHVQCNEQAQERARNTMREQDTDTYAGADEPLSDAYMSGMPSKKRRCVRQSRPPTTLTGFIQESLETAVVRLPAAEDERVRAIFHVAIRDMARSRAEQSLDYNARRYPAVEEMARGDSPSDEGPALPEHSDNSGGL
ncbi:uncharacterized protein LOC123705000 isoform X2 [Colias croceus]|uniref:uncharacterized protein LOC123705000 isoform X2 n=1 Tax=Colias crocea TaxID=72248 RepID=UPI001E27FD92|nr:uncharacterized protein LOC123705000 isoform X2 [Colias croceus]